MLNTFTPFNLAALFTREIKSMRILKSFTVTKSFVRACGYSLCEFIETAQVVHETWCSQEDHNILMTLTSKI